MPLLPVSVFCLSLRVVASCSVHTVDSVFRPEPSPILVGCRPSAACRWGSDVGCASGKNIGCAYRKARVRFACCAREWLCSLPGRSWSCYLAVLPAPPVLLPLLPSALLRRRRCVGGRRGWRVHLLHWQECPGCQAEDSVRNGCSCMRHVEHDDRSDRLDLRARDADGGSYPRRVAERLNTL
jgi:hypothetical protein